MDTCANSLLTVETMLPPTYAFCLVFRIFKDTLIHKIHFTITRDRELWMPTGTMPYAHFDRRYCLSHYLSRGWPEPETPELDNKRRFAELYGDDLFLCPNCGRYHPYLRESDAHTFVQKLAEGSDIIDGGGRWGMKLTDAAASRVYRFANSRLRFRSFQIKQCDERRECNELHRDQTAEHNRFIRRTSEIATHEPPENEFPQPTPKQTADFLYLIQGGLFFKIGITKDIQKRLGHLQTSCPMPLKVIKSWQLDEARIVERHLHKLFQEYQTSGEWFLLPEAEVLQLCTFDESALRSYGVGKVIVPFPIELIQYR